MGIWGCGQHWASSIQPWPSKGAGTTKLRMSWTLCRRNTMPRPAPCCVRCRMLRPKRHARLYAQSSPPASRKLAPKAVERLGDDWERLVTFYQFPRAHWPHLRTSNVVESPFATVRLRTTAAKRFKKVENATAVIWKILQVA